MESIAGWIAPVATIIASMMTAANLGARVTGWGFVIFTIGSVCWSTVGISTGQINLIASNGFLTLVNLLGIWRWLGRQRKYEDGGKSASTASRRSSTPTLFSATGIVGMPVTDSEHQTLGKAVEALIECATGEISYIVVASGGIAERLRAVPRDRVAFGSKQLQLKMAARAFGELPELADGEWPATAEFAPVRSYQLDTARIVGAADKTPRHHY